MGARSHAGRGFTWDDEKARRVWREHRIRLAEVCEVFDGRYAVDEEYDEAHSDYEIRYRALGLLGNRVVVVVYTFHDEGVIHLVTAWKANKSEQIRYYESSFGDQR